MGTKARKAWTLALMWLLATACADAKTSAAADELFASGRFAEAKRAYLTAINNGPDQTHAITRLGEIALLSNRLSEAERFLGGAAVANGDNKDAKRFLAEVYVRQHRFADAARMNRELGNQSKADQLDELSHGVPYDVPKGFRQAQIPFVVTDPLPLIAVWLDGHESVNFLIDTGGSDIIVDDSLAKAAAIPTFGSSTGTFAGGKTSALVRGKLDSLTLGSLTVRNVPVFVQNTRRYSAVFGGKEVAGIIGTVFLSQFLSTIDYQNSKLILRRRSAKLESTTKGTSIPFWLAQDHLILARGAVNKSLPMMMLVDTGLAGMGLTAPRSVLESAGVHIGEAKIEGIGGGGTVQAQPFTADSVSLGPITHRDIDGVYGVFPQKMEDVDGVRVAALISHQFFLHCSVTFDFRKMQMHLIEFP